MKFFEYLKEAKEGGAKFATPKDKYFVPLKGEIVDTKDSTAVKVVSLQGIILIAHLLSKLPSEETLSEGSAKKVAEQVLAFTKKGNLTAGIALPRIEKKVYDSAVNFFFKDVAIVNSALHKYMKEITVFEANKVDPAKSIGFKDIIALIKKEHDLIAFDAGEGSTEVSKEDEAKVSDFKKEVEAKVNELKLGAVGKSFSGALPGIKGASAYSFIGSKTPNIVLFGEVEGKEYLLTFPATKENIEETFEDSEALAKKKLDVSIKDEKGTFKQAYEKALKDIEEKWKRDNKNLWYGTWNDLSDDQKKKMKIHNIKSKEDFFEYAREQYFKKNETEIKKMANLKAKNEIENNEYKISYEEVIKYLSSEDFVVRGGFTDAFNDDLYNYVKKNKITKYAVRKDTPVNAKITDVKTFVKGKEGVVKINPSLNSIYAQLTDMGAKISDIHVVTHMVKTSKESKNSLEDVLSNKEHTEEEKKEKKAGSYAAYRGAIDALDVEGKDNPFIGFGSGVVYVSTILNASLGIHGGKPNLQIFGKCREAGQNQDKFFITELDPAKTETKNTLAILFKNGAEVFKNVTTVIPELKKKVEANPNELNIINLGKPFVNGEKSIKTIKPELVGGGVKVEVLQVKSERKVVDTASNPSYPRIVYAGSKINSKEIDWKKEVGNKAIDVQATERNSSKMVGFSNKFSGASYLVIKGKA